MIYFENEYGMDAMLDRYKRMLDDLHGIRSQRNMLLEAANERQWDARAVQNIEDEYDPLIGCLERVVWSQARSIEAYAIIHGRSYLGSGFRVVYSAGTPSAIIQRAGEDE